jgi:epoxyqueuosine reductase
MKLRKQVHGDWLNGYGIIKISRQHPPYSVHVKVAAYLIDLGLIGHNTRVITPEYGPRIVG